MRRYVLALAVAGLLWAGNAHVRAGYIPVSIAAETNSDIRTYTGGSNYPVGPTSISVAGVPFDLVPLTSQPVNSLGVIQTANGTPSVFNIPAAVSGATTVYTLMNSAWGASGANVGSIEFQGANGADVTFQIVEGVNIRDHYQDGFNNSATNVVYDPFLNGVQDPNGPDRLDMQTFTLPAAFAGTTLTNIVFSGSGGYPEGAPFLAAVTTETPSAVPEPCSLTLMGLGLVGLAGYVQRQRRRRPA